MCIKKVESFEYKGELYTTEDAALKAAILALSAILMKNWSNAMERGLVEHSDELIYLLKRNKELEDARP
jgi:hypothetical protein